MNCSQRNAEPKGTACAAPLPLKLNISYHGPLFMLSAQPGVVRLPFCSGQFWSHPGNQADKPGEGEGEEEKHQSEEWHRQDGGEGQDGDPEPAENQHPQLMEQVDAEGIGPNVTDGPAAGALLADAQHIAEQDAEGHGGEDHVGRGVLPPQLPAAADERRAHQGEHQPQNAQDVQNKLGNPADLKVAQIPAPHIAAHPAQHQMDPQPPQLDGDDAVRAEGGPQGKEGSEEKAQGQEVTDLPPAGRGGESVNHRVDQVQTDKGV